MSDPISQIFDRYLDQPSTLPGEVRHRVEQACRGEIIQLYALVDLDGSLRLCQSWVTLTANYLAVIRKWQIAGSMSISKWSREAAWKKSSNSRA
jgi:hypothetical protein